MIKLQTFIAELRAVWGYMWRFSRYMNGAESLKVGCQIWWMQFAPAHLTMQIGLTLIWSEMNDTRKSVGNNLLGGWRIEDYSWFAQPCHSRCAAEPKSLCQVGTKNNSPSIWEIVVILFVKRFTTFWSWRRLLSKMYSHWRRMIGTLLPTKLASKEWRHSCSLKLNKLPTTLSVGRKNDAYDFLSL